MISYSTQHQARNAAQRLANRFNRPYVVHWSLTAKSWVARPFEQEAEDSLVKETIEPKELVL